MTCKRARFLGASLMLGASLTGWGQSADALIDKLVGKGILNEEEAKELRQEADRDFRKAYSVKSGLPEWVTSFKFNGDVRLRYEGMHIDDAQVSSGTQATDRNQYRYRLRFGVTAVMVERIEVGFRLGSGELDSASPLSLNQTFDNNASKKGIFIDQVYGKWTAIQSPDWTLSMAGGKMENPLTSSDLLFDTDYTPEGADLQVTRRLNDHHELKLTGGWFVLSEDAALEHDPYYLAGQVRWEANWSKAVKSSLGLAWLTLSGVENLDSANVPNINTGNTRVPPVSSSGVNTELAGNYNPIYADAAVTYKLAHVPLYHGDFPITVGGDYLHNPAVAQDNDGWSAMIRLGKAERKGTWDVSYTYRWLESDAWYEELVEGDWSGFYGVAAPELGAAAGQRSGTNIRGHKLKLEYAPFNGTILAIALIRSALINEYPDPLASSPDSAVNRVQVDVNFKF
jgi:hypothetical protein